ncbi:immunoglobulin-like domain-containing protein [Vibrio sp. SCSIO 43136]|uniref:immunoglobulin-like domain-containing protein n=1 Tax=Vibrio sp. SCSIO 43136 TaxID=2819101 RepID=UPI002075FE19|nr:immunoglobulin-like domain-containing protein [Vibrio sp. SCSIO 43136]USD67919.1 DUF5011 domain-containing protein [Vibrio sp. SCSIO 43136]
MQVKKLSIYTILMSAVVVTSGCNQEDKRTFVDVTAPAISIKGNVVTRLEAGQPHIDAGATARDDVDGPVPVVATGNIDQDGQVDTSELGQSAIVYTATDSSNNSSSAIRTLIIEDTLAPVVTLNGENPVTLEAGRDEYVEHGATALDSYDGVLELTISGSVDHNQLGQYQVTYSAMDRSNNVGTAVRTVNVIDTIAPELTLHGDRYIELISPQEFVDPGASAVDLFEGALPVVVSGSVDHMTPGTYHLTYRATDSSGNSSADSRTVVVKSLDRALDLNVKNYFDGTTVANSNVIATIYKDGGVHQEQRSAVTDSEGKATLFVPKDSQRITVLSDAWDYGYYGKAISVAEANVDLFQQPVVAKKRFTPGHDSNFTVSVSDIDIIELDTSFIIDLQGYAPSIDLMSEVTVIDPAHDPALMPGNYETVGEDGVVRNIESFGAVTLGINDENRNKYKMLDGFYATVRIPLASSVQSAPKHLSLYYYDFESGYWVEGPRAELMSNGTSQYYQGKVSKFLTWSAVNPIQTIRINGHVVDKNNNRVAGVNVSTQGVDYSGRNWATTDINGEFAVAAKANSKVLLSASSKDGESRTQTIVTGSEDIQLSESIVLTESAAVVTLTWGATPSDLDTQFFGPDSESGDSSFLVYHGNKHHHFETGSVWLDVDDTSGFGPEVTTVETLPYQGRYSYAVKNYSRSGSIVSSPGRVELSFQGRKQVFSPPVGPESYCWAVFDFVVNHGGGITIEEKSSWEDDAYCSGQRTSRFSTMFEVENVSILQDLIIKKYYK